MDSSALPSYDLFPSIVIKKITIIDIHIKINIFKKTDCRIYKHRLLIYHSTKKRNKNTKHVQILVCCLPTTVSSSAAVAHQLQGLIIFEFRNSIQYTLVVKSGYLNSCFISIILS